MSEEATAITTPDATAGQSSNSSTTAADAASVGSTGNVSAAPLDWSKHIPKEIAQEKVWEQYKGKPIDEVLKQHVALSKYNVNAIKLPDEKDPERGKKLGEIYTKLGRPADPTGYKAEIALPEGVQLSEQHDQSFRQQAHALGLSNSQYEGVMKFYAGYLADGMQGQQQVAGKSREEGEKALRSEWGINYDKNLDLGKRGVGAMALDTLGNQTEATELVNRVFESDLANDPAFVKMMTRIGVLTKQDTLVQGEDSVAFNAEAIDRKIAELKADPDYRNDRSPRKPFLVAEVDKLYQQRYNPALAGA